MKEPLSFHQYFKGNIKKVSSLIISIIFSILLIGSIHMFLINSIDLAKMVSNQYHFYTFIDTEGNTIDEKVYQNPDIERIIPVIIDVVPFQGMAINSNGEILLMDREDIIYLMHILKIDFKEKFVPENDLNQLILDEKLIKNNDFKTGSSIDSKQPLIMNIGFKSNYLIGFLPVSEVELNIHFTSKDDTRNKGYIIVPKKSKFDEVNQYLKENVNSNFNVVDKNYYDSIVENVTDDVENLFNIVTFIVLISIGVGLGISTYVHYFQRRKEFGVLSSLGYSDKKILFRINKEIYYTSLSALLISLLLLLLEKSLINIFLLNPKGIPGFELNVQLFMRIIVIPLFTSVFSLVPTWILLRKIDCVSIIEGEI
ncbi:FtsX-like permease family protein [Mycoplasmatota bacterium]|nr:FtsX-like permease family protein [Mycoplasmatota bacterium]